MARYRTLDLDTIDSDPEQARKKFTGIQALADSIEEEGGLLQAIVVQKKGDRWEIVAGERRWRALWLLVRKGKPEFARVKCQVRTVNESRNGQAVASGLAENLCRDDLHPVEAARGIAAALEDRAWTPKRLGKVIGRSQGWLSAHRKIARDLHPEIAAEFLRTKAGVAWRTLYEAAQMLDSNGEPDLDRQRRHIDGGGRNRTATLKGRLTAKTVRERAKRLARSRKFPPAVRKLIPQIAELLLLGENNP